MSAVGRRRPNPPLPNGWKWGFPVLAALLAIWGAVLLTGGLTTVLDSRRGETREAVTDPSAAGFEAFVEQTWSMLVATEDASGDLVQVAVVAAADRSGGGGSVLLIPVEASIPGTNGSEGCETACRLVDRHRDGGLDAVRAGTASILDVQVTGATLLTPARWESLAGAVEPVSVTLGDDLVATAADGTSVVRFPAGSAPVSATDVVDLFGFPGVDAAAADGLERLARQQRWWGGWMDALAGGDPRERLPNLELDVIDLLATMSGGQVRVLPAPWVVEGGALVADTARLTDLVVEMFPFPIPRVPGLRPSVRLLNGTGDPSVDRPSREAVLRAGVELAVVGNYRNDGVIQTRVIHRDPHLEAAAEALAAAIGGGVLFDQYLSPVTDLTVVIGADFLLRG